MPKQHEQVGRLRSLLRGLSAAPSADREAVAWAIRVGEAADNLVNVKGRHHAELAYKRLEEAVNGTADA